MKNNNELLENLPETILKTVQINRVVCMAVDFLSDGASSESVEAIQTTLRIQEGILGEIFDNVGEINNEYGEDKLPVDLQDDISETIQINRVVCMAVDFLSNVPSSENVEAIQTTLQIQQGKLLYIYDKTGKVIFPNHE